MVRSPSAGPCDCQGAGGLLKADNVSLARTVPPSSCLHLAQTLLREPARPAPPLAGAEQANLQAPGTSPGCCPSCPVTSQQPPLPRAVACQVRVVPGLLPASSLGTLSRQQMGLRAPRQSLATLRATVPDVSLRRRHSGSPGRAAAAALSAAALSPAGPPRPLQTGPPSRRDSPTQGAGTLGPSLSALPSCPQLRPQGVPGLSGS